MTKKITRRDFNLASAMTILSGVAITVVGCGDEGPTAPSAAPSPPAPAPAPEPAPPPSAPMPESVEGVVSANHGHVAVVTGAQLTSGGTVRIDIMGNATHPHTVELTAGELDQIAAGDRVSKASSTNLEHSHVVTFN